MKPLYFFILLLTAQFFIGIQSSYSVVKDHISSDLDVSESFFSVVELLNMIGRFISTIGLVLFPPNKLKLTYFIFVVIQTVSTIIVLGMHIFPEQYQVFFCIGMFGLGFGRGIYMFPYLLMYQNFQRLDQEDQQKKTTSKMLLNIFLGMMLLGHAIVIPLTRWFVEDLKISWAGSMLIFALIYLFTGILVCAFIPQQLVRREEEIEDKTFGEKFCEIFQTLKNFFQRKGSNVVLLFDYCFLDNQTSSIVYWVPFFFAQEGFGFDSTWMVFSYSIGTSIGSLTINPLLKFYPGAAPIATIFLLLFECCCFLAVYFIERDHESLGVFVALYGIAAICLISPYSRSASTEVGERVENDRENYLVINFMRVVRQLVSALSILFIGQMMELDPINFLYIMIGNAFLSSILHIIRRIKENREREEERRQKNETSPRKKKRRSKKKQENDDEKKNPENQKEKEKEKEKEKKKSEKKEEQNGQTQKELNLQYEDLIKPDSEKQIGKFQGFF